MATSPQQKGGSPHLLIFPRGQLNFHVSGKNSVKLPSKCFKCHLAGTVGRELRKFNPDRITFVLHSILSELSRL